MSEIAARYVTVYPKMATGASRTITSDVDSAVARGAATGGKAVGVGMEKAVQQSAPKLGQTFKSVIAPVLTTAALVSVLQFVRKSVDAYSELEDATAAASVTFGDSMSVIEKASNDASKSLGISKQQYIDGAITMGTFGKSAGLAGNDLADFSTQMVQTAGDMASFRGTTPEQAIEAVGAALRGETEPIRQYGVLLDDASLRQQALAMGLIKTTKEALTPQQRVLAAQAAILKQTSDAQGDFARTSDSTANTQKMLAAESANLSAEIGQKLAPSIVAAQRAGIGMLQWASDNMAVLSPLAATVGTLAVAVGGFVLAAKGIEALKSARDTVKGLGLALDAMSVKAKVATASAGAIGLALTAVSIGYGIWAQQTQEATAQVEDMTEAIKADSGALGENARAYAANALQKSGALDVAQKMGVAAETVVDAALGEASAVDAITAARQRQIEAFDKGPHGADQLTDSRIAQLGYERLQDQIGGLTETTVDARRNQAQFSSAVSGTSAATDSAGSSAGDAAIQFGKWKKSLEDTYSVQLKMRGDKRAFEAAIDDAAEAVRKNGKTLDINTAKGRANQAALDQIASSAKDVAAGMTDADVASGKAAKFMAESRREFIKTAVSMGKSRDEAKALADELGLLPSKKVIPVDLRISWSGVLSKQISVDGKGAGKIALKADGGPIRGGVPGKDSVLMMGMPDEHMLTVQDVRNLGGHDGVYRMRALAGQGLLRFASGGPVMPSYKGHSLEWWQDKLLTNTETTRLRIQIRDLKSSLVEKETYTVKGKKRRRLALRGLDRTEAKQELRDAEERLRLAREAAKANSSKSGTLEEQIAKYEQDAAVFKDAASMWQDAAASLTKSGGFGSLDAASVMRTNASGDVWYEKKALTAADLVSRVTQQANQVQTFVNLLGELRKAGASEALISDVMSLGTVDGIKAAQLFLADRKQLAIANSAYSQLDSAGKKLTAIGDAAGGIAVTINEAVTPQATMHAVVNGILAGRT